MGRESEGNVPDKRVSGGSSREKKEKEGKSKDTKKRDRSVEREDRDKEKRRDKEKDKKGKERHRSESRSRSKERHSTKESVREKDTERLKDKEKESRHKDRDKERRKSDSKSLRSPRERRNRSSSRSPPPSDDERGQSKRQKSDSNTVQSSSAVAPKPVIETTEEKLQKRKERIKAWQEAQAKSLATETMVVIEKATESLVIQTVPGNADASQELKDTTTSLDDFMPIRGTSSSKTVEGDEENRMETDEQVAETEEADDKPLGWSLENEEEDDNVDATEAPENSSSIGGGEQTLDQYETQLPLMSERLLQPNGAVELNESSSINRPNLQDEEVAAVFTASTGSKPATAAIPPAVGFKRGKKKASKWGDKQETQPASQPPPTPTQRAPTQSNIATAPPAVAESADPLDEFMTSLYGAGDVETQKELTSAARGKHAINPMHVFAAKPGAAPVDDEYDEGKIFYSESSKVNPFGSNFITMEDIILSSAGAVGSSAAESKSGVEASIFSDVSRHKKKKSGWESDVVEEENEPVNQEKSWLFSGGEEISPSETDEEREAREERERQEFIEAIRKAREEEDVAREKLRELDSIKASEALTAAAKKESMGRVFAGEGDMMDEVEVFEKKKTALEMLEEAKRGKMLKEVDHSKIEYLPFRKNLYIVPRALSKLSEAEVQEKRDDLHVKVRGRGCPVPVDTWEQCGLSDRILLIINKNDLKEPFPIQKQAIPAIMCGRDVIGVAKTGSGKTLAFLLPMFRHIQDQTPLSDNEGPIGMVLAPARELALQICSEAKKFTKKLGMRVTCIYGGAGVAEQIADLRRGSDIVVCTPGRMIDILCMQAGKLISLQRVTMVVMDEADRMFDMGFEPQIKMIMQNIRPDRQTVLFSATFPKQIEKLAKSVLKFPLEIIVGERSSVNKDITQFVEVLEEEDKFLRLLQLLGLWYEKGSILIFVDKQEKCDQLFQDLLKLGYPCLSLHGGKDQVDRDFTLNEFKTGIKTVMVATSVAGRGLDVPDIVCVINYNCPNHLEDYVHRVGRTGRAGRKGTAYTFISSKEEQYSPVMVKVIEKAGQAPVPADLLEMCAQFKSKVAKGEAHWSSSGFVGKGFTFDSSEMNETQKIASMQRRAYEIDQGMVPESKVHDEDEVEGGEVEDRRAPTALQLANMTPLERAKALAASLAATSAAGPAVVVGEGGVLKIDAQAAMAKARLIAQQMESLANNPNNLTSLQAQLAGGLAASYYADELDINDYPFQARRKVTNRQSIDDLTERTGVAIISRGAFVPPGKKLEPGERKLHLLIEGSSEMSVRQAKLELQRALDEETMKIGASVSSGIGLGSLAGGSSGRYSVL